MPRVSKADSPAPEAAALKLRAISPLRPTLACVLGSGFQHAAKQLTSVAEISFADTPGFPELSVGGHAGRVLIGHLRKTPVIVLSGRGHYYEGYSMHQVTFPIRALAAMGVKHLLLTNAAGGINRKLRPGDFMLVTDHINLMPENPLRGGAVYGTTRFVDLSHTYDSGMQKLLQKAARTAGVRLKSGVYLAVGGPSYETPAEIRAFAKLGADAVGMSTVPEAIVARQCGLAVAALSCISNSAAGIAKKPISHAEVLEVGEQMQSQAAGLLSHFAALYRQTWTHGQSKS